MTDFRVVSGENDGFFDETLRRLASGAGGVFDSEAARFEASQRGKKLVISVLGNVNAGKSKMINALTGMHLADVKPVAGWTKHVSLYPLPGNEAVLIADTPGLQDVDANVSQRAEEFVEKDSDVVLFFVNAAVGVTALEQQTYTRLRAAGCPVVVVVNKIDAVDEDERGVALGDIREKLKISAAEFVYPTSAKTGEGIDELRGAIFDLLAASGKDLLFARAVKDKDQIVDRWITTAAASAAAIGLLPIPGADTVPLTALQVALCLKIAHAYEVTVSKADILPFITEIAAGRLGKMIFSTVLKGLGWMAGPVGAALAAAAAAAVAGSMTYGIGMAAKTWYRSGMKTPFNELGEVFEGAADRYKKSKVRDGRRGSTGGESGIARS